MVFVCCVAVAVAAVAVVPIVIAVAVVVATLSQRSCGKWIIQRIFSGHF